MDDAPPPPDRPVSLAGGAGLDELARWAASERVDEAARSRAAQRRHGAAEASESTVAGLLARMAEGTRPVLVDTVGGDRMRGRVAVVGADFCVIAGASGQAMVPTAAIVAVGEAPGPSGDRPGPGPLALEAEAPGAAFGEALAALAAERPLVRIAAGGRHWRGRLASAGADVVSVVAAPGPGPAEAAASHIAVAAIDHLVILDR